MAWLKQIDRSKLPRNAWVMTSWNSNARKWFCALWPNPETTDDPALAVGQGDDPLEAMLAMCIDLGAIAETGEWTGQILDGK